ncbi:hypothetical protein ACFQZE_24430 [Paenibacillus sp. GCM10027627]|uniref:hypothetical protein n=1 Tax=unclassified Paenibacillus TaxID=185978 RepID=UPI003633A9E8
MGKPQFSTELADFNQAQINAIEAAVDQVDLAVAQVGQALTDLKNTDVAQLATLIDEVGFSPPYYTIQTGAHQSLSTLTVNGAGTLVLIHNNGSEGFASLQIDNGPITSFFMRGASVITLPLRFKTNLKLTAAGATIGNGLGAIYTLD